MSLSGLESVMFSGFDGGGESVWDSQKEELFNNLGWVEEVVDDGMRISYEVFNPLAIREPLREGNDDEKLLIGMSQEEVSKWVLKIITGFSKFLGVSFDGFEERTMQLFSDIEETWRKGASNEVKKSGSRTSLGARELKRLQCSVNYDGHRKDGKEGERGGGRVEGVNLLSSYEN